MSARLSRRLRALRRRDDGTTLAELMIAMVLTSIVSTIAIGALLGISDAATNASDRTLASNAARNTLQAWTEDLRVTDGTTPGSRSNRVEYLAPTDILFYADLGNRAYATGAVTSPPVMLWLRLDPSGFLVEEQFASTAGKGSTPTVCRLLGTRVSTPATLFSPYDSGGNALPNTQPRLTTLSCCQPLAVNPPSRTQSVASYLQSLYSVTIDFVISDTRRSHPLEFMSQAVLPSMGAA